MGCGFCVDGSGLEATCLNLHLSVRGAQLSGGSGGCWRRFGENDGLAQRVQPKELTREQAWCGLGVVYHHDALQPTRVLGVVDEPAHGELERVKFLAVREQRLMSIADGGGHLMPVGARALHGAEDAP